MGRLEVPLYTWFSSCTADDLSRRGKVGRWIVYKSTSRRTRKPRHANSSWVAAWRTVTVEVALKWWRSGGGAGRGERWWNTRPSTARSSRLAVKNREGPRPIYSSSTLTVFWFEEFSESWEHPPGALTLSKVFFIFFPKRFDIVASFRGSVYSLALSFSRLSIYRARHKSHPTPNPNTL